MQNWFGKAIQREGTYYTLTLNEIYTTNDFDNCRKKNVFNVLRGIKDFDNVRIIKLQILKQNNNFSHKLSLDELE